MNWEYISGFFDADGSIFLSKNSVKEYKTVNINFTNTDLELLKSIKEFIYNELHIKGGLRKKTLTNILHTQAYTLDYKNRSALQLCTYIKSNHYKKRLRINLCLSDYISVTARNGKYSEELLLKKLQFEYNFLNL